MRSDNETDTGHSDAERLARAPKATLELLLKYSEGSLVRAQSRFAALDDKASQSIGLIGIIGGILAFAPLSSNANQAGDAVLMAAAAFLIGAAFCSLLALTVRLTREPPTVGGVLTILAGADLSVSDVAYMCSMIVDLANAERSHLDASHAKARMVRIAQGLQAVGVVLVFAYLMIEKLS